MVFYIFIAMLALTISTCVLAFLRGGRAERLTAAVIIATIPLTLVMSAFPINLHPILELVADGGIAFVVLGLTLLYASRWLGAVLLLYSAQFALSAYYFVAQRSEDGFYQDTNNFIFFSVTVCLFIGTLSGMLARRPSAISREAVA